jgi:hypothetical protein
MLSERGAAAQVSIAAKNSTPARNRKHFFICVGAQMPFFSVFAQPWSRVGAHAATILHTCSGARPLRFMFLKLR